MDPGNAIATPKKVANISHSLRVNQALIFLRFACCSDVSFRPTLRVKSRSLPKVGCSF
jgi:hypothetical protein